VNSQQFIQILKKPETLDQSTLPALKEMIDNYPFFPLARILYLRNLKNINSYKFEEELSKHAVFIPDRAALYRFLFFPARIDDGFELLPFDNESINKLMEEAEFSGEEQSLSDDFYIQTSEAIRLIEPEDDLLNEQRSLKPDLIDKFIAAGTTKDGFRQAKKEDERDLADQSSIVGEELITETLAKIYMKQGLYNEALQSYQKLILKFPEKNSYFAGQIENIKKLISKE